MVLTIKKELSSDLGYSSLEQDKQVRVPSLKSYFPTSSDLLCGHCGPVWGCNNATGENAAGRVRLLKYEVVSSGVR